MGDGCPPQAPLLTAVVAAFNSADLPLRGLGRKQQSCPWIQASKGRAVLWGCEEKVPLTHSPISCAADKAKGCEEPVLPALPGCGLIKYLEGGKFHDLTGSDDEKAWHLISRVAVGLSSPRVCKREAESRGREREGESSSEDLK